MTVLNQAIKKIRETKTNLFRPEEVVTILQSLREAEIQQIRDVWEQSFKWHYENAYGKVPNKFPNLETYITQLKQP